MQTVLCGRGYSAQILEILNEAIENSTALWDYQARTLAMMDDWFATKEAMDFPVIGVLDESDRVLAFGTYGTFRAFPAYKYTVEHSVYVERTQRGKGLGVAVLHALIERATQQGFHTLVGCIEARNAASIALHRKCGFQPCGVIHHAGFKFGEWIDLSLYQRLLDAPAHPVDG